MRVAVLGAGYAGVTAVRQLERRLPEGEDAPEDVELVLVDERDHHLVQHELHRVVRRPSLAEEVSIPLREILDSADLLLGRVTDVDPEAGTADLAPPQTDGRAVAADETGGIEGADDGEGGTGGEEAGDGEEEGDAVTVDRVESEWTLSFDAGVVCLGAETAFYGLPGVREHATPLKRLHHAREIRREFLALADAGEARVVVGGAGLSGVQVAGELAALAREEGLDPQVILLEQEEQVAPRFPAKFGGTLREELERRDVEVRTGHTVRRATDEVVETDRGEVPYDQFVWTGGIRGGDAVGGDRSAVNRHLRLGPRTLGAGDAVKVVDADGEPAPAAAQTAVRQAPIAAENVIRLVEYDLGIDGDDVFEPRLDSYRHDSPGWAVSVGDGAVAQVGPAVFTGRTAKAVKTTVGAGYLTSVGEVHRAVDLVNQELGIADAVRSEPDVEVVED